MTRTFCVFGFPGTYTHMAFHLWIFQKCTRRGWPFTFRCTSFHFHQISGSAISHHRGPISPHEPQQTWGGSGHLGAPQADRVRRGRSAAKKLVGHGIGAPLGWVREPNSKRGVFFCVWDSWNVWNFCTEVGGTSNFWIFWTFRYWVSLIDVDFQWFSWFWGNRITGLTRRKNTMAITVRVSSDFPIIQ